MSLKAHEQKVEPRKLFVTFTEDESGGEPEDPSDRWTHHADRVKTMTVKGIHKTAPDPRTFGRHVSYDGIVVEDEEVFKKQFVYLVVVRYYDGGTFGRTCGYHIFWSIRATEAEVIADKENIQGPKKDGYREWDGYFSGLEDVEIHLLPLLP